MYIYITLFNYAFNLNLLSKQFDFNLFTKTAIEISIGQLLQNVDITCLHSIDFSIVLLLFTMKIGIL